MGNMPKYWFFIAGQDFKKGDRVGISIIDGKVCAYSDQSCAQGTFNWTMVSDAQKGDELQMSPDGSRVCRRKGEVDMEMGTKIVYEGGSNKFVSKEMEDS